MADIQSKDQFDHNSKRPADPKDVITGNISKQNGSQLKRNRLTMKSLQLSSNFFSLLILSLMRTVSDKICRRLMLLCLKIELITLKSMETWGQCGKTLFFSVAM